MAFTRRTRESQLVALVSIVALVFLTGSCASQRGARDPAPDPSFDGRSSEAAGPGAPPESSVRSEELMAASAEPAPVPPLPSNPPLPQAPPSSPDSALQRLLASGTVRIGLATDLESITLPCCDGELSVEINGARLDLISAVRVRPASAAVGGLAFRVQVAALHDERQAGELARRLGELSGLAAESRFDAQAGLYRVRLGRFATRSAAEDGARSLTRFGVDSSWVVTEGAAIENPALELDHRGRTYRIAGRRFVLAAAENSGVRWDGKRYRGQLVVFLNNRGRLNLVNELPLEAYLRGVVPRELGPNAYPELEALKAQAIAARSYTLRNLGEFGDEGYDLCATPRCQVYGGMDDEHPLSNRAVEETSGLALVSGGQPIDALYSATCGGHTENVETIFPLKRASYLRGVPCIEAGVVHLAAGTGDRAGSVARAVLRRILPGQNLAVSDAAGLERLLQALAARAGLTVPATELDSLDRREVARFLGAAFDLATDARLFVSPLELGYLVANAPAEWNERDLQLAAYLLKSGFLAPPDFRDVADADVGPSRISGREFEQLLVELAKFLRLVESRSTTFSNLEAGELVVRDEGNEAHFKIDPALATFRDLEGDVRAGDLELVAGDAMTLYFVDGGLVAVVQAVDRRGATFDRSHSLSRWTRFRSDQELVASVAARLPGFPFRSFEVVSRGVSGRVGKIRLRGSDGQTLEVEGLAVRWTLDVPDTLFTARRLAPAGRPAGWQFSGRGWGHGVGLCQVGAYGMARRGHDAAEILAHYYQGATLVSLGGGSMRTAAPL